MDSNVRGVYAVVDHEGFLAKSFGLSIKTYFDFWLYLLNFVFFLIVILFVFLFLTFGLLCTDLLLILQIDIKVLMAIQKYELRGELFAEFRFGVRFALTNNINLSMEMLVIPGFFSDGF